MLFRFLALLCALALPLAAQTTYIPSAPPTEENSPRFSVARSGNDVMITWELPETLEVKQFEIYRNTSKSPTGRTRATACRTEPAIYLDVVTDLKATYWYWLKITLTNGQTINIGPVSTPDATVWQP
jgi:hypothetical protein